VRISEVVANGGEWKCREWTMWEGRKGRKEEKKERERERERSCWMDRRMERVNEMKGEEEQEQ